MKEHKESVTGLAVLCFVDGSLLYASCSGDATVKIWKREKPSIGNFKNVTLDLFSNFSNEYLIRFVFQIPENFPNEYLLNGSRLFLSINFKLTPFD